MDTAFTGANSSDMVSHRTISSPCNHRVEE